MRQIYHLVNRGVEKRDIFLSGKDYVRFVDNLIDFNTPENVTQSYHRRRNGRTSHVGQQLVDVLAWSLLPNHPHLMVMEKVEGGAGLYAKKIFGGYTKYFNEQNKRSGVLFQGRTKKVLIKRDAHFLFVPLYVHFNPLDLFESGWRDRGVTNVHRAVEFLGSYRWSSYRNIVGQSSDFLEVINKELFFEIFGSGSRHQKDLEEWLSDGRATSVGKL